MSDVPQQHMSSIWTVAALLAWHCPGNPGTMLALLLPLQLHSKSDWRTDLAGKLPGFFFFHVCQAVFSQERKLVEQAEIKMSWIHSPSAAILISFFLSPLGKVQGAQGQAELWRTL